MTAAELRGAEGAGRNIVEGYQECSGRPAKSRLLVLDARTLNGPRPGYVITLLDAVILARWQMLSDDQSDDQQFQD
jgi:hypothetical protein